MADIISKEKRSWNMSRIGAKDTSVEIKVRKYLFAQGFRYRKNVVKLPGKPDIVLKKYMTVIFVNGCFWHRHAGCSRASVPKTNIDYWNAKFTKNIENDKKHKRELEELGYRVIILWECEINKKFSETMNKVLAVLREGNI